MVYILKKSDKMVKPINIYLIWVILPLFDPRWLPFWGNSWFFQKFNYFTHLVIKSYNFPEKIRQNGQTNQYLHIWVIFWPILTHFLPKMLIWLKTGFFLKKIFSSFLSLYNAWTFSEKILTRLCSKTAKRDFSWKIGLCHFFTFIDP